MGLLGLSFGLAFVVGPALGGFLASKFESLTAPLVAAAALCGLNACLLSFLPESHSRSTTTTSTSTSKAGPTEKPSALAILQLDSLFQRWYRSPGAETMENCESAAPSSEAKSNEDATVVDGRNRGAASRQASMTMRSLTPLSKQAIQHAACLRNLLLSKLAFNLAKGGYESLFTQHLRRRFGSNDSEVTSFGLISFSAFFLRVDVLRSLRT
jgi:MFS family permease